MNKLRKSTSFIMVLLIAFTNLQIPYVVNGNYVYAAESVASISLSANPAVGAASSTVTATVYAADNSPIAGAMVDFSTSFGLLDSTSEATNASGQALVNLRSNTSGTATVVASSGGVSTSTEVQLMTDADAVAADETWLTYNRVCNNIDPSNIIGNICLPIEGENGSTISWSSSNTEVVALDGTVTRPIYTQGNKEVTLTASISKGDSLTVQKEFTVTVVALDPTDAEAVAADKAWLTDELVLNGNSDIFTVINNLLLPIEGENGSTISWLSSNTEVVALGGTVNRPSYTQGDTDVTLTASISRGDSLAVQKELTVTVVALDQTDDEAVAADEAWLTYAVFLNENSDRWSLETNLTFPTIGPNGSAISWVSTDETLVTSNGTVTKPPYARTFNGGTCVCLLATISKGASAVQKDFYVGVVPLDPTEDELAVEADFNWLTEELVCNYAYFLDIREDLYLPEQGENGSTISWTSSNTDVVALDGTVTRPSYTQGDTEVTLTATISKGDSLAVQKEFWVTVVALDQTDAERVAADAAWLTDELVLEHNNSRNDIKMDLYFPESGPNLSTISWTSSNEAVIALDGTVTRPTAIEGDQSLSITATISRGAEIVEKTFDILVTIIENVPLSLKCDDFSNVDTMLQFNGTASIVDTVDRSNQDIQALQFANDELSPGGSVFVNNKIHLTDDMSFSTAFSFRTKHGDFTLGDGGFTFTLQADDSSAYDLSSDSLGAGGIKPSLSIAFDAEYKKRQNSYNQGTTYYSTDRVAVFYNGNDDSASTDRERFLAFGYTDNEASHVWIEYDGSSNILEVRLSSTMEKPLEPTLQVGNLDLASIFTSAEDGLSIEDVQNVFVGFTGSTGSADEATEIWNWYFKNDSIPVDIGPYVFLDASHISLSAYPSAGASTSTITASVSGIYSPTAGVLLEYFTSFGSLNSSSASTDSLGQASVILSTDETGTAIVRAIAAGGAFATTEVQLALTDADRVAVDQKWLTDALVLNGNSSLNSVTTDLYLPKLGCSGCNISWVSNNENLVTLDGEVTTPSPDDGDRMVALKATISCGSEQVEKVFNIIVKVLDEDILFADGEWLTDVLVNGNSSLDSITGNLCMPEIGEYGCNIIWTSSNEDIVSLNGTVIRPTYTEGDQQVELRASMAKGVSSLEKTFNLTVQALEATDAEAVVFDEAWLTSELVAGVNGSLNSVTQDLNLPISGPRNTTIGWTSSDENVVAALSGKVNQPTYTQGDQTVTITAIISRGTESINKTFNVIVKALDPTNTEIVAVDKAWLDASRTLGENLSQFSIQSNLSLPSLAPGGSLITWSSDLPEVISKDGVVSRPQHQDEHKSVTMTAALQFEEVCDTRELKFTVLSIPDTVAPQIIGATPENNSTGVSYDCSEITVAFDEEIQKGPNWDSIRLYYLAKSARIEHNQLIITLRSDMDFGKKYTLVVPAGAVTDTSGNLLAEEFRLSYSVEPQQLREIQVISSNPSDKEKQVSVEADISFSYDYSDIVQGKAFNYIVLRARDGAVVPITRHLNGDTVTVSPANELEPGVVYELTIPSGAVKDRYKNESRAKTIHFITQAESTRPEIVSTYPANLQEGVDVYQTIEITVSENVYWYNHRVQLLDDKGNSVTAIMTPVYHYTNGNTGLCLKPTEPLNPQTRYTVLLPYNAMMSRSLRSHMAFDYKISFTTGAGSLTVDKVSPTDEKDMFGNAMSPVNTSVQIEFSSPVTRVQESANIELVDSEGTSVLFDIDELDNRVVLTPVSNLNSSETYTVYIPAGAYTNGSGDLNDTRRFMFTTAPKLNTSVASFTVKPTTNGLINRPLTFNTEWLEGMFDGAKYKITSYVWDFGDGCTASEKSLEHTYSAAGNYRVTLRLQDNKGFTYEYEQTVSIDRITSANVEMRVSPYCHQWLSTIDSDYGVNIDYQLYTVDLSYSGSYLPEEKIQVLLYKDGVLQKDFGSIVTGKGDREYLDEFGHKVDDRGKAFFPFYYKSKSLKLSGTYELGFVFREKAVRVPVSIMTSEDKLPLRIKLYNKSEGKFLDFAGGVFVELDGEKVFAETRWCGDNDGYCYVIDDVDRWRGHKLELSDERFTWFEPVYPERVLPDDIVILKVQNVLPQINYIKSEYSDSRKDSRKYFMEGVSVPVVFEFDGDDNGVGFGYYELLITDEFRNLHRMDSSGEVGQLKTKYPHVTLDPGLCMRPGDRLFVRMVSQRGVKSGWVDARIGVVPKPSFGSELNVKLEDGEYLIDTSMGIDALIGGRISILDKVPFLDNSTSFGLGNSNNKLRGVLDKDGYITLHFGGGYTYGKEKSIGLKSSGYEVSADLSGMVVLYPSGKVCWGRICLDGDGNYYFTRDYTVPVVDLGITSTLTLGSEIGATLIIDDGENAKDYKGIIYFAPYVTASIDAGFDWVSLEGYLTGIIPSEVHIPTGYVEAEPTIYAGIVGHFLGYSEELYNKDLVKVHWDNGKSKVLTAMAASAQPLEIEFDLDDTELKPMSRNYLNRESQWLAKGVGETAQFGIMAVALADESNLQVEVMKNNVYPNADIQLVLSGDEIWMVWTDDNPERSALNRTQMCYSVLKDGTWSEPERIGADGTADFGPVIASTENGVLMAWQNIKQTMPDHAEPGMLVESAEISVTASAYGTDNSGVETITLTDDNKFDHSPKLAADGDNALLVWTKSEGLGFTLGADMEEYRSPADSDRLVYSSWDGSGWSTPEEIAASLPTVMNSSLTMHESEGLLLYTLDMDNNQSTSGDQELFARIYDGSAWGEEIRITDNQVSDANPKAIYSNGDWFITWYQNGSILYQEGLDGESTTEEFLTKVQSIYGMAVKNGVNPQIALIYRRMGENNARGLSASFYDIEHGMWSDEIQLTNEEGYIRSFSPMFTGDDKLKIAYTQAEIITEVIDGDEYPKTSDKVDLYMMTYTPVHDLALSEEDGLRLSPEIPLPSTTVTVSATISNQGDFAESATLYLYDGDPKSGGIKIGEVRTVQPIPARSSTQVEVQWIVNSAERARYDIHALVKPKQGIIETDEGNNTINHEIVTADIAVTDLSYENLAKDDYLVEARVANIGGISLDGIQVQLKHSQSGQVLESKELNQLRSGQEVNLNFLISSHGLLADENGKINMTLTVSLPDGVEESSSDNNTYVFELEPAPIVVERMSPVPGETQVGTEQLLILSFNMNVDQGAGFEQILLEDDYLNAIDINKTLEGNTLTVTPQSSLAYNARYTLTIPMDALGDSYGHTMDDAVRLSFVTTTSSPEIVFAYPCDGLKDVALDTETKVQFNQNVGNGPSFKDIVVYGPESEVVPASVSIQEEWLYIKCRGNLEQNTSYSLVIPAGAVENDKGEVLQHDYSLGFTTKEVLPPTGESGGTPSKPVTPPTPIDDSGIITEEVVATTEGGITVVTTITTVVDETLRVLARQAAEYGEVLTISMPEVGDDEPQVGADGRAIVRKYRFALTNEQLALVINEERLSDEVGLNIQLTNGTVIGLPNALLRRLRSNGDDLNIEVGKVPNEEAREHMQQDDTVYDVKEIDTNFIGETKLRFAAPPDVNPEDLKIKVIHSDGTIEEITPTVVIDEEGNSYLEFTVDRFSTFIVYKAAGEEMPKQICLTIDKTTATIHGELFTLDASPFIKASTNRTLVPVRFVSECLGAKVEWVSETRQVLITNEGKEIILTIDSDVVLVDGVETQIDSPAEVVCSRTFVPLRFVSETLGAEVEYKQATRGIVITKYTVQS